MHLVARVASRQASDFMIEWRRMRRRFPRVLGVFAAVLLLVSAAVVGCGHSTFDFLSDEANMDSGSGGELPPPAGSGGRPPVGSGGMFPMLPGSGGLASSGGEGGGGGEGGAPPCLGPGCPKPCCSDIEITCRPFDPCAHCSRPDQCLIGFSCDPLTDQCLPGCDDHFDCPDHLRLCDDSRGVCTECLEDVHCRDKRTCLQGFCVACNQEC